MNKLFKRLTPAAVLSLPVLAFAQQSLDPADAKPPAQPLRYESAFADYRPWQDVKPGNWRQLNDNLAPAPGKAGGHAGHGAASPAASAAAPAGSASAVPGHQGHHMQRGKQ
jgi:hypothetical protein